MDTNHNNKHRKDFWTRLSTAVQFTDNGLYGLMDTNGDVVLDANYDHIQICTDFVYAHYGTRHKFIYKNGSEEDCLDRENEHQFYENGKVGLKDSNGNILIPPQYDEVYEWGYDSDVIYVRCGKEFHYYNHNLEEILTDVDSIEDDTEPECPYSIGEDQNRNIMLCVEPISAKERNRDCFAYGQWVRLSRISCNDVRKMFSNCSMVNIPSNAIERFEDENTYIYYARICKCKGESPIMSCIEKFKTLGCYNSSWNYLLKISTNRSTTINSYDLYGVIKHFEDMEDDTCIRYDIAIDHDESLAVGEVCILQIHYFWDDMGEFLDDYFIQETLPNGTVEDIRNGLNCYTPLERRKMIHDAYWWIRRSETRDWAETERVLNYLKAEGSGDMALLISSMTDINDYYIEDMTDADWDFRKKTITWALANGAQLNFVESGMTCYEKVLSSISIAKERKEEFNEIK